MNRRWTAIFAGSIGLWMATTALLALMVVVGIALALFAPTLSGAITSTGSLIVGLILTIVPALLWLFFFYSQDRLEPEPHSYVVGVFVLGALAGGALAQPLFSTVFQVHRWFEPGTLTHLICAVMLNGVVNAALAYIVVRFSVMPTDEFDERVDGIIYSTAAALGLGVAANLAYLTNNETISLGVGALTIIVTSLAYATFGAVLGYFLGWIKPGGGPDWLAPLGVLSAGILHGLYEWIEAQLGSQGMHYNPWPSLIATTIFAAGTFALTFYLIQRTYQPPAQQAREMVNLKKGT